MFYVSVRQGAENCNVDVRAPQARETSKGDMHSPENFEIKSL